MTATSPEATPSGWPGPETIVLAGRPVRPGIPSSGLSRFEDDRWDLSPAIFEENSQSASLNHALVTHRFRPFVKLYCWLELSYDGEVTILRGSGISGRVSVRTLLHLHRNIRAFLEWAGQRQVTTLGQITPNDLDDYLAAVRKADIPDGYKSDLLHAVRRIWSFRSVLPPEWRLPPEPCWKGRDTRILLGRSERPAENATRRIGEQAMTTLLAWAIRFVEDFSDDIITALAEFRPAIGVHPGRGRAVPGSRRCRRPGTGGLRSELAELLDDFRSRGDELPGKQLPGGEREPDWWHLSRLLDCNYQNLQQYQGLIADSGVPVGAGTYLRARPSAILEGSPWMKRFSYHDMDHLARHLSTACMIVIAYLSGMRPGEVLTLRRNCLARDEATGLWQLTGRQWKNAVDDDGSKIPEGKVRHDPWTVIEPVARAVRVLERLHDSGLLFPVRVLGHGHSRAGGSRTYASANGDLQLFVNWINQYCAETGRAGTIGGTDGRLTLSRFRRTLAWFICRRPRGLVAAAIQYGHVRVQITQGYGGTYASGFPDDLAFETWLTRLDELDTADQRLRDGEHVSGPAAEAYTGRVAGGSGRFAGRVIRSGRQARHILANPSLQVYPGKGMTCVFTAATALCQLSVSGDDATQTPDVDDCKPRCRNIARTDTDIETVREEAASLRQIISDQASPPIRLARERARLEHLGNIISRHESAAAGESR